MSEFSSRLKLLRLEHNLSQRQLAKATEISHSAICAYENEKREPSFESLEALCDVFNCDIDYILGRTDIKNAVANSLGYSSLYEKYQNEQTSPTEPKLTEGEEMLLQLFRQIPEEQQRVFLEMGRVFANNLRKD